MPVMLDSPVTTAGRTLTAEAWAGRQTTSDQTAGHGRPPDRRGSDGEVREGNAGPGHDERGGDLNKTSDGEC